MKWALENRKITSNAVQFMKVPPANRRERYLTPKNESRFRQFPRGDPFRDFLFALEQTGCRPGEVCRVTAADVDLRTGVGNWPTTRRRGRPAKAASSF